MKDLIKRKRGQKIKYENNRKMKKKNRIMYKGNE